MMLCLLSYYTVLYNITSYFFNSWTNFPHKLVVSWHVRNVTHLAPTWANGVTNKDSCMYAFHLYGLCYGFLFSKISSGCSLLSGWPFANLPTLVGLGGGHTGNAILYRRST